jgi:hypothetical protein
LPPFIKSPSLWYTSINHNLFPTRRGKIMTDKQEIRIKALEFTFDFFTMLRPVKISPGQSEPPNPNDGSNKPIEGDWLLDGIFKTCEQFENFILKAPDEPHG